MSETQRDDVSADATPITARVHRSKVGTYHPEPRLMPNGDESPFEAAWTINDTRGYTDGGPSCEECGACECPVCPHCDGKSCAEPNPHCRKIENHLAEGQEDYGECAGLSFAFVCLDGGEALCETCATKAGVEIVECDCE